VTKLSHLRPSILRDINSQGTVLPLTIFCVLLVLVIKPAQAQNFSVIHAFTDGVDGAFPEASLTIDETGNLYGTTIIGGGVNGRDCDPRAAGCGVAFKMMPHNGGWIFAPLFAFDDFDGAAPVAPLTFGPGGLLYGSTTDGGNNLNCFSSFYGCGVVFTLQPPPTICRSALCYWLENPIYTFTSESDGFEPMGNLAFDQAGNIYGTTAYGGTNTCGTGANCGNVFQLSRSGSAWTKTTLYNFTPGSDGIWPVSGVITDSSGVLYGITNQGGTYDFGTVFELTPSESGWTETVIYNFQDGVDGGGPWGGLLMDAEGNLYGTTATGGAGHGGTVFELSPSGGRWTFSVVASLFGVEGGGSVGSLTFDSAGNLYGTTRGDGAYGYGNIFKLTPSGRQWIYSDLYDFTGGSDGRSPYAGVTLDSGGNLYGTTLEGGNTGGACASFGCGVVFEITPE
jgi:uncharacterized repeat protein (TIGR03803 family)